MALDLVIAAGGPPQASDYSGKVKVLAVNDAGTHRLVEAVDSEGEAEERLVVIQRDFELLSIPAWCKKYDVPISFAEG